MHRDHTLREHDGIVRHSPCMELQILLKACIMATNITFYSTHFEVYNVCASLQCQLAIFKLRYHTILGHFAELNARRNYPSYDSYPVASTVEFIYNNYVHVHTFLFIVIFVIPFKIYDHEVLICVI